jgi:hypothetical protein
MNSKGLGIRSNAIDATVAVDVKDVKDASGRSGAGASEHSKINLPQTEVSPLVSSSLAISNGG